MFTMGGIVYPTQLQLSRMTTSYPGYSAHLRDSQASSALKAQVSDAGFSAHDLNELMEAVRATKSSPLSGYQEESFVAAASDKAVKVPALSPTPSFTVPTTQDAPVPQLPSPPSCYVAAEQSGAEDVVPRAPAAVMLLTADELLGGSAPAPSCETGAAAYRREAQQLAWAHGKCLTWSAAAQQQVQQEFVVVPAAPIMLEDRWNAMFISLDAAAKIGQRLTYAMAAAGVR